MTAAEGLKMMDGDSAARSADLRVATMATFWYGCYVFGIKHLCASSKYAAAISPSRMSLTGRRVIKVVNMG